MNHKLSVLVQVDLERTCCRLSVTGRLTEINQQALYPLIHKARTLPSDIRVVVDLTSARGAEGDALELLRRVVDSDDATDHAGPVQFLVPGRISSEEASPADATVLLRARRGAQEAPSHAVLTSPTGEMEAVR